MYRDLGGVSELIYDSLFLGIFGMCLNPFAIIERLFGFGGRV